MLLVDPRASVRAGATSRYIKYGSSSLSSSDKAQQRTTLHEGIHRTKAATPWNAWTLKFRRQIPHQDPFNEAVSALKRLARKNREK